MAQLCEMCGMGWCGRPCINDPLKRNGLLFHGDGRLKTLKERGLAWDSPPLVAATPAPARKRPTMVLLKELSKRGAVAGTKIPAPRTENKGTENQAAISVPTMVAKRGRGRPKTGKPLTAAERKRRWLERQKPKK